MICFVCLLLLIIVQLALGSTNTAPVCFGDDGETPAPAATDCISAMANVKNDPFYTTPQIYGVDENPPSNVPIKWSNRSCLVIIGVEDGSQTDKFALSTTMPALASLAELCIFKKARGQGFGGYIPIGHGKTFYALLQWDPDYQPPFISSHLHLASNGTSNMTNDRVPGSSDSTSTA